MRISAMHEDCHCVISLVQATHGHEMAVSVPGRLVRLSAAACDGLAPTWYMHGAVLQHARMHNKEALLWARGGLRWPTERAR